MINKRQSLIYKIIILIYICLSLFGVVGCEQSLPLNQSPSGSKDFSVNFLDVGQGDCIYIKLPDGKNMMIDCGVNDANQQNLQYIKNYLEQYNVNKIDYFVLTHPDLDHIGNAEEIMGEFDIGKMFIPKIHQAQMSSFEEFERVVKLIDQKKIDFEYSMLSTKIIGKDYFFAFLSPQIGQDSSYDKLAQAEVPSDSDINNISPIIYFNCFGKRFVFTGDAEKQEEHHVVRNFRNGFYDKIHYNLNIDLNNVDYLKLSHHGSEDASSEEFLSLLNPKNVIISVGNDNYYGHPSSETLLNLQAFCTDYKLYRTDQLGSICIYKNDQNFLVQTVKNN